MRLLNRLWIISSIDLVASSALHKSATADELRVQYLAALCHLQPWTAIQWTPDRPVVTFNNSRAIADFIRREAWSPTDTDYDRHLFSPDEQVRLVRLVEQAFTLVSGVSHDLRGLIDLTIGELLLARKQGHGGGTISSAVGLIWLNPGLKWSRWTMAENIVHEWIHNMLFLADMVDPVFSANYLELGQESSQVISAILHRRRPFDRSYHSAAVAAGLVFFRDIAGDTHNADRLIEPALTTVKELKDRRDLLTQSGIDLLEEIEALLWTRDSNRILDLLAGKVGPPSLDGLRR
jgi:hypothetical protein